MEPFYETPDTRLYLGDVREALGALAPASVHCVVTSPPYLGLRDYHVSPSAWGGRADCEHEPSRSEGEETCQRCGAWRGCLGMEPTPQLYVEHIVEVARYVARVLRADGTFWLNVADSYAGSGRGPTGHNGIGNQWERQGFVDPGASRVPGIPAKSRMLVPERLLIALQEDGWIVRQVICWVKQAPMPESVDDRPVSAWEPIFLLARSPDYYYDHYAVREPGEPAQTAHNRRYARPYLLADGHAGERQPGSVNHIGIHARPGPGGHNLRNVWILPPDPMDCDYCAHCDTLYRGPARWRLRKVRTPEGERRVCPRCGSAEGWVNHFAAFPEALPERVILAATSERGVCPHCGAPWRRIVERFPAAVQRPRAFSHPANLDRCDAGALYAETEVRTLGWAPGCPCYATPPPPDAPPRGATEDERRRYVERLTAWLSPLRALPTVPATVLDPFLGSGTTALVARRLGRRVIGIDLSERYLRLAVSRLESQPPSLFGAGVEL